ncbi:MipA/OmpV family protein [Halioxenophilus aromaticivorans]|uniref:MipA/OmpV family protein n=1 Tax=Halioxenophilus aromaticivorans TaxID=1306992 RepID=A0AAV3U0B9_9ALTE
MAPLLAACCLLVSSLGHAASLNDTARADQRPWQLGVTLGYGQRSNPLVDADNLNLIAVVDFSWYGERWFFDNGDVGFTLVDNHRFTLNAIARVNTERLFFENTNSLLVSFAGSDQLGSDGGDGLQQGGVDSDGNDGLDSDGSGGTPSDGGSGSTTEFDIPDRDYALEAGFEVLTDGPWGFAQASLVHDISNKHDGYEANLSLGRSGHWQRFTWTASAGLSYRSQQLNDYYYGILPGEAVAGYARYSADDGLNFHASTLLRYYLSKSMSLGLVLEYETLSDAIADSPFVTDDHITTAYAGVKYTF